VTFAEGFLSAKASTRGKGPSPRVSPLSAKALNPVVSMGIWCSNIHVGLLVTHLVVNMLHISIHGFGVFDLR
jgi:hypothetical protein